MDTANIEKVSLQLSFYNGNIGEPYTRNYGYISPEATDEKLTAFINKIGNIALDNITVRRKVVVYTLPYGG